MLKGGILDSDLRRTFGSKKREHLVVCCVVVVGVNNLMKKW